MCGECTRKSKLVRREGRGKKKSGLTDTSRDKTRAKKRKNETLLKTLSPNETRRGEGEIRPCVSSKERKEYFSREKETDEIEDGERTPKCHYWDTGTTEVHVAYLRHPRRLGSTISCDKVAPDVSAGRAMHPPRRTNSLTPTRALYTRETRTSARVAVDRASLASYICRLLCVRACASLCLSLYSHFRRLCSSKTRGSTLLHSVTSASLRIYARFIARRDD